MAFPAHLKLATTVLLLLMLILTFAKTSQASNNVLLIRANWFRTSMFGRLSSLRLQNGIEAPYLLNHNVKNMGKPIRRNAPAHQNQPEPAKATCQTRQTLSDPHQIPTEPT
jgi:hypothetical protein